MDKISFHSNNGSYAVTVNNRYAGEVMRHDGAWKALPLGVGAAYEAFWQRASAFRTRIDAARSLA